jgi:hypothetical protein
MPKSELQGMASFYQTAQAGTIFAADDNYPSQLNGRYNLFDEKILYGEDGIVSLDKSFSEKGSAITRVVSQNDPNTHQPVYVLISGSMQAYGTAYGFLRPNQLEKLSESLAHTPGWFRLFHNSGLTVFEMAPAS